MQERFELTHLLLHFLTLREYDHLSWETELAWREFTYINNRRQRHLGIPGIND